MFIIDVTTVTPNGRALHCTYMTAAHLQQINTALTRVAQYELFHALHWWQYENYLHGVSSAFVWKSLQTFSKLLKICRKTNISHNHSHKTV